MVIACIISFIIDATIMLCIIGVVSNCKVEEPINTVHFYVARDRSGTLTLWLGKPYRGEYFWTFADRTVLIATNYELNLYGLDIEDYTYLALEDEPVEVFLNLKD